MVRQQRHALGCGMSTAITMRPVVLPDERAVRAGTNRVGKPERTALLTIGAQPRRRRLMLARERMRQVLDLQQLPNKRGSRVLVTGPE